MQQPQEVASRKLRWMAAIGPGILVAATGVGAGDLGSGAIAGSKLGLAVLWAVVVGAVLKFALNEGLARWQLATGTTFLEGCSRHLGSGVQWVFLAYLLLWSFFVGTALIGACGIAAHAIFPLPELEIGLGDGARQDKVLYGIAQSLLAVGLVYLGGYKLFEKIMSACIALMFVVVCVTAYLVKPSWSGLLAGLIPTMPAEGADGIQWTVALIGGVGGTVTVLCYGYWIREEGREGPEQLGPSRLDLAVGYVMTALFGLGLVIIGSQVQVEGGGAKLVVQLAESLEQQLGPMGKWSFLIGAWAAVFSSLLGVWQSVPYLFADTCRLLRHGDSGDRRIDTRGLPYRGFLWALAIVPIAGMVWADFQTAQKYYAIVGAFFIPLLAVALMLLNRRKYVGELRTRLLGTVVLIAALAFFVFFGALEIRRRWSPPPPVVSGVPSHVMPATPATK